jgi:hypothetical protein
MFNFLGNAPAQLVYPHLNFEEDKSLELVAKITLGKV